MTWALVFLTKTAVDSKDLTRLMFQFVMMSESFNLPVGGLVAIEMAVAYSYDRIN